MGKIAFRYLETEENGLLENGFHKDRNKVSESLFSLGNEYSGVRGFFEEGSSLPSLIGTYYNGIIETSLQDTPSAYKGIAKRSHFTINSPNYLKVDIKIDGEKVDLGKEEAINFIRHLSFLTGELERSFAIKRGNKNIHLCFKRILGMTSPHQASQTISFKSDEDVHLEISFYIDGTILHWGQDNYWNPGKVYLDENEQGLFLKTLSNAQSLLTLMHLDSPLPIKKTDSSDKWIRLDYEGELKKDQEILFTRYVINLIDKQGSDNETSMYQEAKSELDLLKKKGFAGILKENEAFFAKNKAESDIEIEGDESDQQGIRFCLFNLLQAYTGLDGDNNIGAKGLTGEAYSGHAFWDSETYCLPYYLFSNQESAKNLLMFRYNTLPQARERAKELDCEGAAFPIATRNGKEACTLWQHASTQLQATTGVFYAITHYMNIYDDKEFMNKYGVEMILEIVKFLHTRGQWNSTHTHFGYYGVMGPDEFEVMVNHNTYTNYMAKRAFEYALDLVKDPEYRDTQLMKKLGITPEFLQAIGEEADKMLILYDEKTLLYEQHQGFYDLPHIDIDSIPVTDFPLYSHWTYDRIYRNDIIKQPDVLMFMFLYSQDFPLEVKKANYEYYEPRCLHESSLSPSVHSIIACELGKEEDASTFFGFATRLDLDDYNRNTEEGLHMTSIAAAWMNIVYGFLGLRSEKGPLRVSPTLPKKWKSYSVRLSYRGSPLKFIVKGDALLIENQGEPVTIFVYDKKTLIEGKVEIKRG